MREQGCSITIVPSETDAGCFRWIIHAPDGRRLMHSPYAFASKAAARLSGECWRQELISGNSSV